MIRRKRFIHNKQAWVGYTSAQPPLDINRLILGNGFFLSSENNWCRRLVYALGLSLCFRRMV